jgi:hypothetical protein
MTPTSTAPSAQAPSPSPLRHFTSYTGNVKEALKELPLSGLNAIVGEEATYKSTIAIGIRLALSGKYEPVGSLPSDLISLAADPLVGIHCLLSGPDGFAEWRLKVDPETAKPKRPEPPHFEGPINALSEDERYCIIPTDSVRDLLKGARGDKKLREAFLRRFGGALKDIPTPFALEDEEKKVWEEAKADIARRLGDDSSADSVLAGLSEYFRKESIAKRKEITPIERFVSDKKTWLTQQEMAEGLAPELVDEYREQLAKAIAWDACESDRKAKATLEGTIKGKREELETAEKGLLTCRQEQLELNEASKTSLDAAIAESKGAREKTVKTRSAVAAYKMLAELYAKSEEENLAKCRFCSTEFADLEPIKATRKLFEERVAAREAEAAEAEKAEHETKVRLDQKQAELTDERLRLAREEMGLSQTVANARRTIESSEAELKATTVRLAKSPKSYSGPAASELQEKVAVIDQMAQSRAALEREGLRMRRLEREYGVLKKLEGEAMAVQKLVMKKVAKVASDEVSLGMLDGRRARLDPVTCDWYMTRRDGKEYGPFGVLSGTERTSLLLGLVGAWTRGSPLRVAIFDDEDMVGLSTKGIRDFYTQLEELYDRGDFTQVVVVNNRPELVPQDGRWNTILRTPRARTPEEAVVDV